jgi:hypothetical protein
MLGARPTPEQLEEAAPHEFVLRLVHPTSYTGRLETSCLPSRDWKGKPTATDYGPSAFLEARLPGGVAELEAANHDWKRFGVVRLQIRELNERGVVVRMTPMDCQFPTIAHAHATLFGVTSANRDDVVELFAARIQRVPPRAA